jgi:RimJ/RimL family protein N-acetyltransferase
MMLTALKPDRYEAARMLFAAWRPYLVLFAVINRNIPGMIFVDDEQHPQTAVVWDHDEGELYLTGRADNEAVIRSLNATIRDQIRPYGQEHLPHLSEFTLYCDTEKWAPHISTVLAGLDPMEHRRRLYLLDRLPEYPQYSIPDGYTIARIDEKVFNSPLAGVDVMRDWILRRWRTAADVARSQVGYFISHGRNLVSWCVSEYQGQPFPGGGRECQVSIYTREAYRRSGFGALVARATAQACLEAGMQRIGWHCWGRNVASAATAERVGFKLAVDRPVYNGCFNRFDNFLLQAYYLSEANRPHEAITRWEAAFALWEAGDPDALGSPHCRAFPDTVAWCYYAAGRTRAEWGEYEPALSHLNKAVDNGWRDADRLKEDRQLHALQDTAGWRALLLRIERLRGGESEN